MDEAHPCLVPNAVQAALPTGTGRAANNSPTAAICYRATRAPKGVKAKSVVRRPYRLPTIAGAANLNGRTGVCTAAELGWPRSCR